MLISYFCVGAVLKGQIFLLPVSEISFVCLCFQAVASKHMCRTAPRGQFLKNQVPETSTSFSNRSSGPYVEPSSLPLENAMTP